VEVAGEVQASNDPKEFDRAFDKVAPRPKGTRQEKP
jgi:hypothetical protein